MANHLTPTELGREAGMHRREVISKCMEMGVPIFRAGSTRPCSSPTSSRSRRTKELPRRSARPGRGRVRLESAS